MRSHGKDTTILIDTVDASGFFTQGSAPSGIDMANITTFTKEDPVFLPGLSSGSVNLTGLYDTVNTPALDDFAKTAGEVLGLFPGGTTVGNRGKFGLTKQSSLVTSPPVGDVVALSYAAQADGGWDSGPSLHSVAAAETGAGSSAGVGGLPMWLDLPGTNGSADSDYTTAITGEITLSAQVKADDWTPAADTTIGSQWGAAGNINHALRVDTTGILLFVYSTDGTATVEIASTVTLGSVGATDDSTRMWVRVWHDNDDGSNAVTKFYYSLDPTFNEDEVTWTQLGATVSGVQLAARYSSTFAHKVGISNTADNDFAGSVFSYSARAGSPSAALVYNPIFHSTAQGWVPGDNAADTGTDSQSNTWTLTNDATIDDTSASTANGGAAYLWCTAFTGTDLTVTVEHSADNAAWATLATFTALASGVEDAERQIVAAGTTVNRYLRAEWSTSAGFSSATFTVAFGRR